MSKNILVVIKTLQDVKGVIESENMRKLLALMTKPHSFLGRFKDIDQLTLTPKLRNLSICSIGSRASS